MLVSFLWVCGSSSLKTIFTWLELRANEDRNSCLVVVVLWSKELEYSRGFVVHYDITLMSDSKQPFFVTHSLSGNVPHD